MSPVPIWMPTRVMIMRCTWPTMKKNHMLKATLSGIRYARPSTGRFMRKGTTGTPCMMVTLPTSRIFWNMSL